MKTLQHSRIEYNVNASNFGKVRITPMLVNVPENITRDIEPTSIEYPYITVNKKSKKLLVSKIKYENNGKNTFKIQLVKDLLFSESYFIKQYSNYIMVNIDESIQEHKFMKEYLDQYLQSLNSNTVCVFFFFRIIVFHVTLPVVCFGFVFRILKLMILFILMVHNQNQMD